MLSIVELSLEPWFFSTDSQCGVGSHDEMMMGHSCVGYNAAVIASASCPGDPISQHSTPTCGSRILSTSSSTMFPQP